MGRRVVSTVGMERPTTRNVYEIDISLLLLQNAMQTQSSKHLVEGIPALFHLLHFLFIKFAEDALIFA